MVLKESGRDWWLVAAISLLCIGANLPASVSNWFAFDRRLLILTLTAIVVISLVKYLRLTFVIVTIVLALGANLPSKLADVFRIDPAIMLFTLFVMVVVPLVNRLTKLLPTGFEAKYASKSSHGMKLLFKAVTIGEVSVVQRLVDAGVNVNGRTVSGFSPLMGAASHGYSDIVQLLLGANAEVNAKDNRGRTALFYSESRSYSRTTAFLKHAGGQV